MTNVIKGVFTKLKSKPEQTNVEQVKVKKEWKQYSQEELDNAKYALHSIRLCQLSRISRKKQKKLTFEELQGRIVKDDAFMIHVEGNWYMDIETGKHYELGSLKGDKLEDPKNELYISSDDSFYHTCRDIIYSQNLQHDTEVTVSELKQLYQEYIDSRAFQL